MELLFTQETAPGQMQHPSSWLVYSNELLELPMDALQARLHEEVAANPALELEEHQICPSCGQPLQGAFCPHCQATPSPSTAEALARLEWEEPSGFLQGGLAEAEGSDPLANVAAPVELREALTLALKAELPTEAAPIIDYLVGNLDEDGYLRCTVEETAYVLQVPQRQVELVLAHLHEQEPSGIGARDVRECLLLQMRHLEAQGRSQPYAIEVVEWFLSELAQRNYGLIAKQLGISRRQVEAVHIFLRNELTPFPASSSGEHILSLAMRPQEVIVPQVVIRRQPTEESTPYTVDVVEANQFHLRLSPAYLEAYQELRHQKATQQEGDLTRLKQQMEQAHLVLISLQRRWHTLGRITRYLVQAQQGYLEQGNAALVSLTRAEVAAALGVHPSTVSRAVAGKYALLPTGNTVPFDTFFQASLPVKEALKALLAQETTPASDQRLTELLAAQGIQIARRTVAKYREELRIPARCRR